MRPIQYLGGDLSPEDKAAAHAWRDHKTTTTAPQEGEPMNANLNENAPTRSGRPVNPVHGIETRLTFGRNISHGPQLGETVTDYSVRAFLDSFVLSRFPLGFTYTESRGAWKGGQEDSFSVSVIYVDHPKTKRDNGIKLEEIRAEYVRLFRQDSVLRADTPVTYSFA